MSKQQPTAGAMRAERVIQHSLECLRCSIGHDSPSMATIIDRKTGLPEFLTACRAIASMEHPVDIKRARALASTVLTLYE